MRHRIIATALCACLVLGAFSCRWRGPATSPPVDPGEEYKGEPVTEAMVPSLVRELLGPDPDRSREELARCELEALPALGRALRTDDAGTVDAVLEVLSIHRDWSARVIIRDLALSAAAEWRRLAALEAIRRIAPREGVDYLLPLGRLLDLSESRAVRLATVCVLVAQPAPPLASRLVAMLGSEDSGAADAAAAALSELAARHEETGVALAADIDAVKPEIVRTRLARALAAAGVRASPASLEKLMLSADPEIRLLALLTLADSGPGERVPLPLFAALKDTDPKVRTAAEDHLLGKATVADAPELITVALEESTPEKRRAELLEMAGKLAGADFSTGADAARSWLAGWLAGRIDPFPRIEAPKSVPLPPEDPLPPVRRNWRGIALALSLGMVAAAGLAAGAFARKRESEPVGEGAAAAGGDSAAVRAGKWIFDNRIAVLLPWFIPPLVLFEQSRMAPAWARIALYSVAAAGFVLRIWATGFRTWAYRSSGDRKLMTSGPYSFVRHPLYVVNFMLSLPVFFIAGPVPFALAFIAWFAITHMLIVTREDATVKVRYPQEWEAWAAKVRRFVPRLTPYSSATAGFSWEPVVKGQEIPKAVAVMVMLVAAFEVFPGYLDLAAAFLRRVLWL